jgi:hypothetical protein
LRTRQAADTAARDNPNIPAWGSADALLDERSAADKRELLPGLPAKSPAGIRAARRSFESTGSLFGSQGSGAISAHM